MSEPDKASIRNAALEDAARAVRSGSGCDCASAPCPHDEADRAAASRVLALKSVQGPASGWQHVGMSDEQLREFAEGFLRQFEWTVAKVLRPVIAKLIETRKVDRVELMKFLDAVDQLRAFLV